MTSSSKKFTGNNVNARQFLRTVQKGGIIMFKGKRFQNINIPIGATGFFDLENLKFHQISAPEHLGYSVKELGIHV